MRAARLSASLPTSGITYAYLGFYAGHLQVSGIFLFNSKKIIIFVIFCKKLLTNIIMIILCILSNENKNK